MEINLKEYPEFKNFILDYGDWIVKSHLSGSTFYYDVVIEVNKEDETYFFADTLPPDPVGYWLIQDVLRSDTYGYDSTDIISAIKVQRKERQIITTEVYYEPIY